MERDEKVKKGELKPSYKKVSEMTEKEKAAYKLSNARASIKVELLMEKAKKAGITVTEAEIDAALKNK